MKRAAVASKGILTGAQKWFTGIVTTLAAVMTLLLNAKNLGLSPFLGLLEPNVADHAAHRIVLTPRADTLRAIGDTASVTATVMDVRGGVLPGATLRWRTSDSSVATVDSTGTIIARAPGRATISVSVREVVASAPVLVRQTAVRIAVAGDTSLRVADGDSLRLAAFAVDAREHRVAGPAPRWSSADSTVARVDTLGQLRTVGAGRTVLTAVHGDLRALVPLEVALTPATIAVVSGAAQRALAGRPLAEPVVLQVRSRAGAPVAGVAVALTTEHGEGALAPAEATTDAQGRVRTQWSLGARAGAQRLFARVAALDSALTAIAYADPVAANTRIEVLGDSLRAPVASQLRALQVRVTDTLGVALAAVRVAWSALDGGAVAGSALTDSAGTATARWTLGRRAGVQRMVVHVGDPRLIPATTVRATAEARAPHALLLRAGDKQSATAGKALAKPIVVQVQDSLGNPVVGAALRTAAAAGTVHDTVATTDATGRATLRWTLGSKAGAQRLDIRLSGTKARLAVSATAKAPVATPVRSEQRRVDKPRARE